MARHSKRRRKEVGSSPGTLLFVGEQKTDRPQISVMAYSAEALDEQDIQEMDRLRSLRQSPSKKWINLIGIHDTTMLEKFGLQFDIHPLTLEDIGNTGHRPKIEEFENYLYLVLKMLQFDPEGLRIESEQVSLVLGPDFLISFQESPGDVFDPVRQRIRKAKGRIRKSGCDYLAYALIDAIVDHYYLILERLGERIEALEETIVSQEIHQQTVREIHFLRSETIFMRKQIWPLREMVSQLSKGEFDLVQPATHPFLSDVYDHVIQIQDTVETYREMLGGLLELYMSSVSNRMNEVMKVLTIIATIFIPITFVAGIYGMNFDHMPELHWRWGYFGAWGIIAAIVGAMLLYFRRKKWL